MANELTVGDEISANCELIEVHVTDLRMLFNPIDPSPPPERDLESKVEEFIVAWARSAKRDAQLALKIDVDTPAAKEQASTVGAAVHEFFRQRSMSASRRLNQLFRVGRTSLIIGLASLAVAVTLASFVDRAFGDHPFSALIRETLVIGGWVAMWRPLEIFLYDWWPIRAERKLYDRLSVMPVRVTIKGQQADAERKAALNLPRGL
jgi:hypothetical protein